RFGLLWTKDMRSSKSSSGNEFRDKGKCSLGQTFRHSAESPLGSRRKRRSGSHTFRDCHRNRQRRRSLLVDLQIAAHAMTEPPVMQLLNHRPSSRTPTNAARLCCCHGKDASRKRLRPPIPTDPLTLITTPLARSLARSRSANPLRQP
ncbi:uncharacterized protein TRIREDRAFT_108431, partial [Trichoderma reesei QM6a]